MAAPQEDVSGGTLSVGGAAEGFAVKRPEGPIGRVEDEVVRIGDHDAG